MDKRGGASGKAVIRRVGCSVTGPPQGSGRFGCGMQTCLSCIYMGVLIYLINCPITIEHRTKNTPAIGGHIITLKLDCKHSFIHSLPMTRMVCHRGVGFSIANSPDLHIFGLLDKNWCSPPAETHGENMQIPQGIKPGIFLLIGRTMTTNCKQ